MAAINGTQLPEGHSKINQGMQTAEVDPTPDAAFPLKLLLSNRDRKLSDKFDEGDPRPEASLEIWVSRKAAIQLFVAIRATAKKMDWPLPKEDE